MLAVIATLSSLAHEAPPIAVSYSTVVDMHVSQIMPVYLSDELNQGRQR